MASAKSPGSEIGVSGLNYSPSGQVDEEIHKNLQGREAIKVFKDMSDNDPLVVAILYAIDMLVRQVPWIVEQGEADDELVEFLEGCMHDMSHSWADFISEVLSMLRFGFAFNEIVYKRRLGPQSEESDVPTSSFSDGKIGWRKFPIRAQESLDHWEFTDEGGLVAFVQRAAPKYAEVPIPIIKGLLFRTTTYKNNPEGRSLLRGAYRPWYYKKRIEEIEGVGLERDLAGFPVINLPAAWLSDQATDHEKAMVAAFAEIGKNIRRDKQEFLILPTLYDENKNELIKLTLLASGGQRTFDTSAIIQRYNQAIAQTVLADFILLGHEKVGSFALSDSKTDIFAVALGTILDVIEDVMNRFAIPRLWNLNAFDPEKMPKLRHGDVDDPDLTALSTYLTTLASIGMPLFPDDDLDTHLRKIAHLPEVSEETKKEREKAQEEAAAQAQQQGVPAPGDLSQQQQDRAAQGGQNDQPFSFGGSGNAAG